VSVYTEAIINAISPSSSTFSTSILTVLSILDGIYEGARLYTEFSKTYPFSKLASMIVFILSD
jgi:hypothetical protein